MQKLAFFLAGSFLFALTACSKRYSYTCYCKTSESTGIGDQIGEYYPKMNKQKAKETCEIFSNSERTCSPVYDK